MIDSNIIPTVFAKKKDEFKIRLERLVKASKNLHVDFMDGRFVPVRGINLKDILDLNSLPNHFEAHLMVKEPEKLIKPLAKKGFKKVMFHFESVKSKKEIKGLIDSVREQGMSPFITLNPETSIQNIIPLLNYVDGVLLMGVHPGKEKQSFIPEVYAKIRKLKKINSSVIIQVDGGVSEETVPELARSGVDLLNSGSYVSSSKNPEKAMMKLKQLYDDAL